MDINLLAGGDTGVGGKISNPVIGDKLNLLFNLPELYIGNLLSKVVGLLFIAGGVSFFFMFVIGAISWIMSGGDKAHLESAKGRITSAIVGFVLLISTFAIIKLIEKFFGISILSIDIGPLVIQ